MNDLRPWLRLSLLALLLGSLSLGCANDDIRHKAEIARDEAVFLEDKVVEPWAIENGKTDWDIATFKDIYRYIPKYHSLRQRNGCDPFGNPYVLNCVAQGVAVNAKTIELCSEVTKHDPLFWGHHDERVLGLIAAAKNDDLDTVRRLVKTVPDPNIPNKGGDKALVFAVAKGNDEMERVLVSHGAVLDPGDGTPLWLAIGKQNVKVVKALLDRFPYMATATNTGAGADGVLKTWQQALSVACFVGNTEIVRMLLERGADPNTGDGDPLWSAVIKGHLDIVRLLVEGGAQITPKALESATGEVRKYLESRLNAAKTKGEQPGSTQK